jgi:hypothetical protein
MRPGVGNAARLHRVAGLRDGPRLISRSPLRLGSYRLAALALVLLTASFAGHADAEIAVDGGRQEMRVRVENDTVGNVLEALRENGILSYRSTTPLTKVIGGSFSGSLGQVVSRVLAGFDFVVTYKPQGAEIFVIEESGAKPTPPPTDAPLPQPESEDAEKAPPGGNLAPSHLAPSAPSSYDRATSNLSMHR